MSLRSFYGPFTVTKWSILVGIIRTLNDVTAAHHVKVAIRGTVDFVRVIATVVLLVALEGGIYTFSIGTKERTRWTGVCTAHKGKKGLACCEFPRLKLIVGDSHVDAFTQHGIWLTGPPKTYKTEKRYMIEHFYEFHIYYIQAQSFYENFSKSLLYYNYYIIMTYLKRCMTCGFLEKRHSPPTLLLTFC